jgi:chromosomal replication initiation ATPase DnaA
LLLITLSHFVNSGVNSYFEAKALKPYFTHSNYMEFKFQLSSGKLPLLQLKFWKATKPYKNSDWEISVSENHLIKLVFPNFVATPEKSNEEPEFTAPEKEEESAPTGFTVISQNEMDEVNLFYDPEIQQFVDRIDKILGKCDGEKLKQICGHMLFYGDSGAGKTALAYYLAKKHGYKILKVEASEITSKYVGEDMKNVNSCFKAYAKLVQTEKVILLFNEVETLMSSRGMANNSSAQHYNAFMSEFLIKMEESKETK